MVSIKCNLRLHVFISCKMVKVVIVLLSALALANAEIGFKSFRNGPKVVGGTVAGVGEFPYQASLQLKGLLGTGHYCGGSIIAPNVILTAGHCITEVSVPLLTHIEIHVGINDLNKEGANLQSSKSSGKKVHPDYPNKVGPNDLAVHFLETPLEYNEFVQPITLAAAGVIPSGNSVLSGWGSTSNTSSPHYPNDLMKVTLPIVPYQECEDAWANAGEAGTVAQSNVCTGPLGTGGLGACSGDSGGPLVQNGTQIGIVSWGSIPCAGGLPSVFTMVSAHRAWIDTQLAFAKTLLPQK